VSKDVFSRDVKYGGSFSADGTRITFGDFRCGMLVQSINYAYTQNISRLYEVGCPDIYLVAGRTQGQAGLSKILGPRRLAKSFYTQFGDACNRNNNIKFTAVTNCGGNEGGAEEVILLKHNVIVNLTGAVNSQDMLVNESMSLMFLLLLFGNN
jgi:hypothetical protein